MTIAPSLACRLPPFGRWCHAPLMDHHARRIASFTTAIFSESSALAAQHQAVNLGQGFPDFDGAEEVREVSVRATGEAAPRSPPTIWRGRLDTVSPSWLRDSRIAALTVLVGAVFTGCIHEAYRRGGKGDKPEPFVHLAEGPEGQTYAYVIGPAPVGCPNWYAALRRARQIAGCNEAGQGDPANPCQKKLKECSACDVCRILEPGKGPEVLVRRMFLYGHMAPDYSRIEFKEEFCSDFSLIGKLTETMIHEATHACPSVGGGPIYDHSRSGPLGRAGLGPTSPDGCTAYQITDACLGGGG